jgi:hypothetical protein
MCLVLRGRGANLNAGRAGEMRGSPHPRAMPLGSITPAKAGDALW